MADLADKIIRWGFYLLFFLVPLIFFSVSFELFEYNKMMLTYGLTIVITAAWLVKIVLNSEFRIQNSGKFLRRTPLDIPILLYLASHIISTVVSLDPHTSIWGYYSRFHEGLLATISYILLYYAAVSNLHKQDVINILKSSFIAGVIVTLWGGLEHFGASPSCLLITGKFDDACWVQDVKNRVFATLGQPNWMAAYLDILILGALGFVLSIKNNVLSKKTASVPSPIIHNSLFIILPVLFFAGLLWTKSRSGILGLIAGLLILGVIIIWKNLRDLKSLRNLGILAAGFTLIALLFGLPFSQIEKLNLESLLQKKTSAAAVQKPSVNPGYIDIGISESGDIRKIVWKGALKVWQRYPIFGSGVETFAYAYYKDRPVEHNMVSEWDFLYNKAHNEFLNILATTGTVGMLTYLSIIGLFSLWFLWFLRSKSYQLQANSFLVPALYAAYISILITNFFGFSVVIIGLFFFLIPAFCYILSQDQQVSHSAVKQSETSGGQWLLISLICLIGLIGLSNLLKMWQADKSFAYGKNLDGVQRYPQAFSYLTDAVNSNPDEPTFRDELSINEGVLAATLFQQASGSAEQKLIQTIPGTNLSSKTLMDKAISDSNQVVESSPNILTFWKTRTKLFYQLATIDQQNIIQALNSISKAAELAPTDAKVHYNYGLLLGQTGQTPQAIKILEETTAMKKDYADAYYALGLYYDQDGQHQKARAQMEYILAHIGNDERAKKWLAENK